MNGDAELFQRWGEGDTRAGEALFERYFEQIYRFFARKVSSDSEELAQRTFTACIEKRSTIREGASFRAFLYGVARLELLMHLRRLQKGDNRVDLSTASMKDFDPSPSYLFGKRQEQHRLLDALRSIPVDQQIVIELHYWEEMSTAEIAGVLEIPQGTVKGRLRIAREKLARALEAQD